MKAVREEWYDENARRYYMSRAWYETVLLFCAGAILQSVLKWRGLSFERISLAASFAAKIRKIFRNAKL